MSKLLAIKPVISEKAQAQAETGTYMFEVPRNASKIAIARTVAERFGVKVATVNTLNQTGKSVQTLVQRGRKRISGRRASIKKAYVTLKSGEKISMFEGSK